jgi:hypothetical protein
MRKRDRTAFWKVAKDREKTTRFISKNSDFLASGSANFITGLLLHLVSLLPAGPDVLARSAGYAPHHPEDSVLYRAASGRSDRRWLIAVNPAPGTIGGMSPSYLEGPGQVRFDMDVIKRIRIGERKEFEFRVDAIDLLNRPNFANPDADINSPTFGRITATNSGNRIIVLNARINF